MKKFSRISCGVDELIKWTTKIDKINSTVSTINLIADIGSWFGVGKESKNDRDARKKGGEVLDEYAKFAKNYLHFSANESTERILKLPVKPDSEQEIRELYFPDYGRFRLDWYIIIEQKFIHKTLIDYFNLEELRTLCLYLDFDYEEIPGTTKSGIVTELIRYCNRHRDEGMKLLIRSALAYRQDIDWRECICVWVLGLEDE